MKRSSAWYWRPRYYHNGDCAWEFLGYQAPNIWWLQREYMEIVT